jgi:hypothetical protein
VTFTGFSSSPPADAPSFDFNSSAGGLSGGTPRLAINFADGRGELRPLELVPGVWTHEDGATDWDTYGGSCGFRSGVTYADVVACHAGSSVYHVWILNDSRWLYPDGNRVLIDNIKYGDDTVFQQDVDTLSTPLPQAPVEDKVSVDPEGAVTVSLPKGTGTGTGTGAFVPLEQAAALPAGSVVNATDGSAELSTVPGLSGRSQSAEFSDGVFKIVNVAPTGTGLTQVRLQGDVPTPCPSGSARAATAARRLLSDVRRHRRRHRLRAAGAAAQQGGFRVLGAYSTATARSARWETVDRCDGTLTRVFRGRVEVRDPRAKGTIVVRAAQRHLAPAT